MAVEQYVMSLSAKTPPRCGLADASAATAVTAKGSVALSLLHLARDVFKLSSAAAVQVGGGVEFIVTE
eukprot:4361814-Pyramimonas_sp.AAC.1